MTMRAACLCLFALLASAGVCEGAKVTHFLQLSVEGEEAGAVQTLKDLEVLVKHAKSEKLGENMLMLLRSSMQKVGKGVEDAKQKRALNAKRNVAKAAKAAELASFRAAEAPFTSGDTTVRPLKLSMHAGKCNIKRYASSKALREALKAGSVDMASPFLVSGAATKENEAVKTFREGWTAEALKAMKNVAIRFLTPRLAKVVMQGEDGQQGGQQATPQTMEVFQPQMVNFATYFATCFGKKKSPGTDTEHCQQAIPALALAELGQGKQATTLGDATAQVLDSLLADLISASGATDDSQLSQLSLMRRYERSLEESIASTKAALNGTDKAAMAKWFGPQAEGYVQSLSALKQTIRTVILGPSASGKAFQSHRHTQPNPQMGEQPKTFASASSFLDVLVFGQRRWVLLSDDRFHSVRRQAGADFGLTTAYQFFESQYEEFKEEYGMSFKEDGAKNGAWECNQNTGDALYVPAGAHATALALDDGLSYRESVATWSSAEDRAHLHARLNREVLDPAASKWAPALCYLDEPALMVDAFPSLDWSTLPFQVAPGEVLTPAKGAAMLAKVLQGAVKEQSSELNVVISQLLASCHAALSLHPAVPTDATVCGKIWDRCSAKLRKSYGGEDGKKELPLNYARAGFASKLAAATPAAPTPAAVAKPSTAPPAPKAKKGKKKSKKSKRKQSKRTTKAKKEL